MYPPERQLKPVNHHLTLKEGSKAKSDHIRRFRAQDFLEVDFTCQTSRTNNKQIISTFNFDYLHLTLKEEPKVKSDIRRLPMHDFLQGGLTLQTSRTKVITTFKFDCPRLTLKEGPQGQILPHQRFPAHNFLQVGFILQTSSTNNTFKFGCPHLTLKEGPKVKSDIKRFPAMIFYKLASLCKPARPIIS